MADPKKKKYSARQEAAKKRKRDSTRRREPDRGWFTSRSSRLPDGTEVIDFTPPQVVKEHHFPPLDVADVTLPPPPTPAQQALDVANWASRAHWFRKKKKKK